jgi:hypothetical protein
MHRAHPEQVHYLGPKSSDELAPDLAECTAGVGGNAGTGWKANSSDGVQKDREKTLDSFSRSPLQRAPGRHYTAALPRSAARAAVDLHR